ncbi:MAG: hypothetical protein V8Q84_03195 [Bilophila sp.]
MPWPKPLSFVSYCAAPTVWRGRPPVPSLRRHKRLQEGFSWRLVPEDWSGPVTRTGEGDTEQIHYAETDIWLQAASGGEAYLIWKSSNALPRARRRRDAPAPCAFWPPHGPGRGWKSCKAWPSKYTRRIRG